MNPQFAELKDRLAEIQRGLFQISRDRIVALPAHSAFELIDELEEKVDLLMKQIEELEKSYPETRTGQSEKKLH